MLLQWLWFFNRVYPERDKGYTCTSVKPQYNHYQGEQKVKSLFTTQGHHHNTADNDGCR